MKNLILVLCFVVSFASMANDKCAYKSHEAAQEKLNEIADESNQNRSFVRYVRENENFVLFIGAVYWQVYYLNVEMTETCDVKEVHVSEMH